MHFEQENDKAQTALNRVRTKLDEAERFKSDEARAMHAAMAAQMRVEAENEKLWMELEKFLVVTPADDGAAPEPPASPEPSEPPPPPPPSGEDEAREAEERREAENRRAQLNLQRQLAEQEALLSRQEEQDMYAYLKSTPTFGTVKDNFVLPGATAK